MTGVARKKRSGRCIMPRRLERRKRRKSTRGKPRKSARTKSRRPTQRKIIKLKLPRLNPSIQSAELIWKETVSPQLIPDIKTLDQSLLMLEEARKQAEGLVAWADRHSKRFETYVLTAISSLNAQIAFEVNVLKVLTLRLGSLMVDIDLLAGKPGLARTVPPELQESILRLREIIGKMVETNGATIEAARKLTMYF